MTYFNSMINKMMPDSDYAEFHYSFTNGFDLNQRITIPLIRIETPPSEDEDDQCYRYKYDADMSDVSCERKTSSCINPSIQHERDCYLMPYSYNDIQSMYIKLPRSRSHSLPVAAAKDGVSCDYPAPCEPCKRYLQIPDIPSLHRHRNRIASVDSVHPSFFNRDKCCYRKVSLDSETRRSEGECCGDDIAQASANISPTISTTSGNSSPDSQKLECYRVDKIEEDDKSYCDGD